MKRPTQRPVQQHSPGPWTNGSGPEQWNGNQVYDADGNGVCTVYGLFQNHKFPELLKDPILADPEGTGIPNALLIGAAVDMKEALKMFLRDIDMACLVEKDHVQSDLAPAVRLALAAIAKAEGRSE